MWIGRKALKKCNVTGLGILGAKINFPIEGSGHTSLFSQRVQILYWVVPIAVWRRHPLVSAITTPEQREAVDNYVHTAGQKDSLQRTDLERQPGVFTGAYALHPVTGEKMPFGWLTMF